MASHGPLRHKETYIHTHTNTHIFNAQFLTAAVPHAVAPARACGGARGKEWHCMDLCVIRKHTHTHTHTNTHIYNAHTHTHTNTHIYNAHVLTAAVPHAVAPACACGGARGKEWHRMDLCVLRKHAHTHTHAHTHIHIYIMRTYSLQLFHTLWRQRVPVVVREAKSGIAWTFAS